MKRLLTIVSSIVVLFAFSCKKQQGQPEPGPERELSVPEKVEKELTDVLSKDWKSLADTLGYFDSTMLSKGKSNGTAPDGVYYELRVDIRDSSSVEAVFIVQDSTWAAVNGRIRPLLVVLTACDTEISIEKEEADSVGLSVSKVKVIAPGGFLFKKDHKASLLYEGKRVGYLTSDDFEDTDYGTVTCLVAHYYNDPRTFALIDNGFGKLLDMSLKDAFK